MATSFYDYRKKIFKNQLMCFVVPFSAVLKSTGGLCKIVKFQNALAFKNNYQKKKKKNSMESAVAYLSDLLFVNHVGNKQTNGKRQ